MIGPQPRTSRGRHHVVILSDRGRCACSVVKVPREPSVAFSPSFRGNVNAKTISGCALVIERGITVTAFDIAEKSDNAISQPLRELAQLSALSRNPVGQVSEA